MLGFWLADDGTNAQPHTSKGRQITWAHWQEAVDNGDATLRALCASREATVRHAKRTVRHSPIAPPYRRRHVVERIEFGNGELGQGIPLRPRCRASVHPREYSMKALTTCCAVALSFSVWACGSVAEKSESDNTEVAQITAPLYEQTLDDGSVLSFYEAEEEPGFISMLIETSIDDPAPSVAPQSKRVTEIYQQYCPDSELPPVLVEAQERQDAFLALQAEASDEVEMDAESAAEGDSPTVAGRVSAAVNEAADTEDDYLYWRAWAWALGTKGRWDQRWLNYSSSHRTDNAEGYYAAVVASENGYVTWKMKYRPNLSWKTAWSVTAAPGHVLYWFNNSDNNWDYQSGIYDVTSGEYYHHAGAYQY